MITVYTSKLILLWLFLINITYCQSYELLDNKIRELSSKFTHNVLFENDKSFMECVVLPNYACSSLCPIAVFQPISSIEVSQAILIAQSLKLNIVIRGGGHGYTCQATKDNSVMFDMRQMKQIRVDINKSSSVITIETGLAWIDVLNYLEKDPVMTAIKINTNKSYTTVHGQCTSVGVAGFSLHGGVHFGGLSELYGLSSDNIRGLTAVLANSSIIELTSNSCIIDGYIIIESSAQLSCQSLFYAFRGAGSSFGIVTSLTLQLYEKPALHTALSIVSLNLNNPVKAQEFLSYYFKTLPEKASVTLFGLNAYFKAYFFVLKFAHNKRKLQAIRNDMVSLIKSRGSPSTQHHHDNGSTSTVSPNEIHFIVEASWLSSTGSCSNTLEHDTISDDTFQQFVQLHNVLRASKEKLNITTTNINGPEEVAVVRDWIPSAHMWSVPSYDLVWGEGHSYGGATIIVDEVYEAQAIQASMKQYFTHLINYSTSLFDSGGAATGDCDDCVAVLHRIGPGLRRIRHDENISSFNSNTNRISTSFNPFRHNASLWIEIDCGHFHRHRAAWQTHCSPFIDATQHALDESVPGLQHKAHYPNVPNLNTQNWQAQYYGEEGYQRLQAVKQEWDPYNIFSHAQSIYNNNSNNINNRDNITIDSVNAGYTNAKDFNINATIITRMINSKSSSSSLMCTGLYDKKAYQQFYRIVLVVGVAITCIILRGTMTAVSRRKKFNRFQWFFTHSNSGGGNKKSKKK